MPITCKEAQEEFGALIEGSIDDARRGEVNVHLNSCNVCLQELRESVHLVALCRSQEQDTCSVSDISLERVWRNLFRQPSRYHFNVVKIFVPLALAAGLAIILGSSFLFPRVSVENRFETANVRSEKPLTVTDSKLFTEDQQDNFPELIPPPITPPASSPEPVEMISPPTPADAPNVTDENAPPTPTVTEVPKDSTVITDQADGSMTPAPEATPPGKIIALPKEEMTPDTPAESISPPQKDSRETSVASTSHIQSSTVETDALEEEISRTDEREQEELRDSEPINQSPSLEVTVSESPPLSLEDGHQVPENLPQVIPPGSTKPERSVVLGDEEPLAISNEEKTTVKKAQERYGLKRSHRVSSPDKKERKSDRPRKRRSPLDLLGVELGGAMIADRGQRSVIGHLSGHALEPSSGVPMTVSDALTMETKTGQETARQYGYTPAQGKKIIGVDALVTPKKSACGERIQLTLQYAVLGSGTSGANIRITAALLLNEQFIVQLSSSNVTCSDGTWQTIQEVQTPPTLSIGTYQLKQRIYEEDSSTVDMDVDFEVTE